MKRDTFIRDYQRALRRLEQSDTPVKRRNARNALRSLLNAAWRRASLKHPALRADGKALAPLKGASPCPGCGKPQRTWEKFGGHVLGCPDINRVAGCYRGQSLVKKRRSGEDTARAIPRCWCGTAAANLGAHFARLRRAGIDPKTHLASVKILRSAQAGGTP